jgi:hypothetical protein
MWPKDGKGAGTCVVPYDTKEHAEGALDVVAPENGPQVVHAWTCEVELEA